VNYGFSLDGWRDAGETRNVTMELVRRGYSAEEVGKIWSGNVLRVWSEVEEVAAQLQR
jgi:membrane dipeptidase